MTDLEVFLQQLIIGLSNGMIIALIALGYTLVYGILELINFAHGEVFMLGAFLALTVIGVLGLNYLIVAAVIVPIFCGGLNLLIERFIYRPIRGSSSLVNLVSAVGISFILVNIGLFWGGLNLDVFAGGRSAAGPKDFPSVFSDVNLLGSSNIFFGTRDLMVVAVTLPLLLALSLFLKFSRLGRAMRAVAQNRTAAQLMGIDSDKVVATCFFIGGALAGVASIVYAIYNGTVGFQMGYRVGLDGFSAAVLGGIGSLTGAVFGGLVIGLMRAVSDQYISPEWTNSVVFGSLICVLLFRPSGIFGISRKERA